MASTAGGRPLHLASGRGFLELVEYLIAGLPGGGAPGLIELGTRKGVTPLMLAENRGHVSVARYIRRAVAAVYKGE